MTLVLIGKDLLLEGKHRTNGFQVYIYIYIPSYSSHLKMHGWKTIIILSFWDTAYFQGRAVSFREGIYPYMYWGTAETASLWIP